MARIPAHFSFSRKERTGLILLLSLLLLLCTVRLSIRYFVPADYNSSNDADLYAAWEKFRQQHITDSIPAFPANVPVNMCYFDPNTLDSVGFRRIGLSAGTTRLLLKWRSKGKIFYRKEDLRALYSLSEDQYKRIEPYIHIAPHRAQEMPGSQTEWRQTPLPHEMDINTVDSATLVRLNGIGPMLAHRIVARRRALGSYLHHRQLLEVYNFPDTTYEMLQQRLKINVSTIRRINVNTVSKELLQSHPYIGEKLAKNILLLREGLGKFEKVQQLRQVPLMNEEIYRKIAPYFTTE